jgi:hypothetical protein
MTTITTRQRAVLVLSAFALVITGAIAGCGEKDDPGVATANPNATAGGTGNAAGRGGFGKCMRDAGFAWYPDEDDSGNLSADPPAGVAVDEQKLQAAKETCAKKVTNGGNGAPPVASAEDIARAKELAKCMRDNGLPNVPDPDANGVIDFRKAGVQDNTPEWKRAMDACQKYAPQPKDRKNGNS